MQEVGQVSMVMQICRFRTRELRERVCVCMRVKDDQGGEESGLTVVTSMSGKPMAVRDSSTVRGVGGHASNLFITTGLHTHGT